jgi:hypothetical protein
MINVVSFIYPKLKKKKKSEAVVGGTRTHAAGAKMYGREP